MLSSVSFLLHGVDHVVAILSLVLVLGTDDGQLSIIFILCVHITKFIIYYVYFQMNVLTKKITILNYTKSHVLLRDNYTNTFFYNSVIYFYIIWIHSYYMADRPRQFYSMNNNIFQIFTCFQLESQIYNK